MAVNLSPVGGVAAQFFDNNGVILSGGKLYTYSAGTTTPATAYTTSQGNVAWTNPIVLNSAGRVPSGGEIWLTDGLIYKFVLKDSNDVTIATYDNISGINSNFVAYTNQQEIQTATAGQTVFTLTTMQYQPGTHSLSVFVDGVNQYGPGALYAYTETSSTVVTFVSGLHVGAEVKFTTTQQQGAGAVAASQVSFTGFKGQVGNVQDLADDDGSDWIGFEQAGTGAVAMSAQDKMRETVSVLDFGADPTGVANSSAAFQAAMDYAYPDLPNGDSTVSKAAVVVPKGVYRLQDPIGFRKLNLADGDYIQEMRGEGATILLDCATTASTGVKEALFTSRDSLANPSSSSNLYASKILIDGLNFQPASGKQQVAFNGDRLYNIRITNCNFKGLWAVARSFRAKPASSIGYFQAFTIDHCQFVDCGIGDDGGNGGVIVGGTAYYINVCDNNAEGCKGAFFQMYGGATFDGVIENNLHESGGPFVNVTNFVGSICGNYLEDNRYGAAAAAYSNGQILFADLIGNEIPSNVKIQNNKIQISSTQAADATYAVIKFGAPLYGSQTHFANISNNSLSPDYAATANLVKTTSGRISTYENNVLGTTSVDINSNFIVERFGYRKNMVVAIGETTTTIRFDLLGGGNLDIKITAVTGYSAAASFGHYTIYGDFATAANFFVITNTATSTPASGTGSAVFGVVTKGNGYIEIPITCVGNNDRATFIEVSGVGTSDVVDGAGSLIDCDGKFDICQISTTRV
jgi:hypothetical protein